MARGGHASRVPLDELLDDLAAEHAALDAVVAPLADDEWDTPTPAPGWAVRHAVAHLTYFDEQGRLAVEDADAFEANKAALLTEPGSIDVAGPAAALAPAALLAAWRDARAGLLAAFAGLDPKDRLPWYGPPMSARSFLTARLMETWAHGVDVYEALGVPVPATDRLRHVAHLGVTTRGWSYAVRGEEPPAAEVHVALEPPTGGEPWTWGPADAPDRVVGPALDFCLVTTQRRPLSSTPALVVTGAAAEGWMTRAQAFAGAATTTTRR
jgi:uncharacterized protein (TIGR03084 family)